MSLYVACMCLYARTCRIHEHTVFQPLISLPLGGAGSAHVLNPSHGRWDAELYLEPLAQILPRARPGPCR